jgi:hypothetical protein
MFVRTFLAKSTFIEIFMSSINHQCATNNIIDMSNSFRLHNTFVILNQ